MLIKAADDKTEFLAELNTRASTDGPDARKAKEDLERWKIGISGEKDAAYFIDFDYGAPKPHWAVIHDLRLEHGGRVAQIDHLLINRLLEVFVLESKNYNCDLKVNERGEFTAFYGRRGFGVPSPLEQNERHITVLREVFQTLDLPERLGIRLMPTFESYVLVSTKARLTFPKDDAYFERVIKADNLTRTISAHLDNMPALAALTKATKMVSNETLHTLARQLVARHRPLQTKHVRSEPVQAPVSSANQATGSLPSPIIAAAPTLAGPACKACGKGSGSILYGQFGYYFKCNDCSTNTSIRFACQTGHKPKLRKAGQVFFRDCAECGTSEPYHANPT